MGKKDKKSKEKKEKIKLKKEKQKLKSLKTKKKKKKTLSDEDFDSICLYYENLNKKDKYGHINVNTTSNNTFVECEKPSPRSNCSLTFINEEEFILFGGEYNDNNELIVYNDLFKYNIIKNKWKYYFTTSKKPKPRCSHQSVYFNKKLYIFGGELCTNTQFFHFNDFWSFDLKSNVFEEIETKNKKEENPSPRSGHRMILWKNCIVMFGGFFDNGKSVEYFNDLYIYIINCNKWVNLTNIYVNYLFKRLTENNTTNNNNNNDDSLSSKSQKKNNDKNHQVLKSKFLKNFDLDSYIPSKRSSVGLFTDTKFQKIYIYGGYSQVKNTSRNAIGIYYNDLWVLNITYMNEDSISVKFKKLKKSIFQPPKRIGFSTCTYKNSLILFGGVFDKFEQSNAKNDNILEESLNMKSIFFNDIYLFDMNKEHWSYLSLKNKETKDLNKNSKENKKKELHENKNGEINSSKNALIEQESTFTENKRDKSEYKDLSDSSDSSYLNDDNNDEYYSNVFVYFDENGYKKTMKIENEEINNENFNEKKECDSYLENILDKQIIEENHIVMNKAVDDHSVFIQDKEPISSNGNNHNENINYLNDLKCVNISKGSKDSKDLDEFYNISDNKGVDEKNSEEVEEVTNNLSSSDTESNRGDKKKKFVINDIEPIGRINSHIFMVNKNLYLYGGMYEYKNNEIILNDYWKINLFKREKWELIDKGNLNDIYVEESELSSSLSIDDEDKDDKEIEDLIICSKIKKIENTMKVEDSGLGFDVNENLNEFFLRTKHYWLKQLNVLSETKQNRKDAFILCEKKYIALKKYYNEIQKYKELLSAEEYERSITEDNSSEQELSD